MVSEKLPEYRSPSRPLLDVLSPGKCEDRHCEKDQEQKLEEVGPCEKQVHYGLHEAGEGHGRGLYICLVFLDSE